MEKEKKLGRIIKNHTNLRKNKQQIQGKKMKNNIYIQQCK